MNIEKKLLRLQNARIILMIISIKAEIVHNYYEGYSKSFGNNYNYKEIYKGNASTLLCEQMYI